MMAGWWLDHQWEISRILKWRYVSTIFLAIFWVYIPWNLGLIYIGLIYGIGTSNQSVPESWPLIRRKMLSGSERNVALFFRLGITKFHVLTNEILPVCPTRKVAKENNTILFLEGCWPQSFWWCIHIIYICIYIYIIYQCSFPVISRSSSDLYWCSKIHEVREPVAIMQWAQ